MVLAADVGAVVGGGAQRRPSDQAFKTREPRTRERLQTSNAAQGVLPIAASPLRADLLWPFSSRLPLTLTQSGSKT